MGFSWVQFHQAFVRGDMVAVRILATETEPDGDDAQEPESVSERF